MMMFTTNGCVRILLRFVHVIHRKNIGVLYITNQSMNENLPQNLLAGVVVKVVIIVVVVVVVVEVMVVMAIVVVDGHLNSQM